MVARTHGATMLPIYKVWSAMHQRCTNTKCRNYKNYGARGITLCNEWFDAANFIVWAYTNGYKPGLNIDRIDNDKGYFPKNCRWATAEVNANNRRNTVWIEAWGERKTLTQWTKDSRCKVNRKLLRQRVRVDGWKAEAAIETPPIKNARIGRPANA